MVVVAFTAAAFTAAMAFMAVTFTAALRTTVLYRTDHSILGMGFVMIMTAFLDHHFVIGNTWPGYYDPYYLGSYDYDYPYEDYTAQDYSDVMPAESVSLAVQRALAQLGYYHGPVDGVVNPQTEKAIRGFQSVNSLPVTGQIDSATLRVLRIG